VKTVYDSENWEGYHAKGHFFPIRISIRVCYIANDLYISVTLMRISHFLARFILSRALEVTDFNSRALELWNMSKEELRGRHINELVIRCAEFPASDKTSEKDLSEDVGLGLERVHSAGSSLGSSYRLENSQWEDVGAYKRERRSSELISDMFTSYALLADNRRISAFVAQYQRKDKSFSLEVLPFSRRTAAVVVLDDNGRLRHCNKIFTFVFGNSHYDEHGFAGAHLSSFVAGDVRRANNLVEDMLFTALNSQDGEVRMIRLKQSDSLDILCRLRVFAFLADSSSSSSSSSTKSQEKTGTTMQSTHYSVFIWALEDVEIDVVDSHFTAGNDQWLEGTHVGGYCIIRLLAKGGFGEVYLAGVDILPGVHVAIKVFSKNKLDAGLRQTDLGREISLLQQMKHPHLPQIYDCIEDERFIYLCMEYIDGPTLTDYINARGPIAPWQESLNMFLPIFSVFSHLESHRIAHRDVKGDNFIVRQRDSSIFLIDFGFAMEVPSDMGYGCSDFCGTPIYSAPEIAQSIPYNPFKSDAWSVGLILWSIVFACLPLQHEDELQTMTGPLEIPPCHDIIHFCLTSLLCIDPHVRLTVSELHAKLQIAHAALLVHKDEASSPAPVSPVSRQLSRCDVEMVESLGFPPSLVQEALYCRSNCLATAIPFLYPLNPELDPCVALRGGDHDDGNEQGKDRDNDKFAMQENYAFTTTVEPLSQGKNLVLERLMHGTLVTEYGYGAEEGHHPRMRTSSFLAPSASPLGPIVRTLSVDRLSEQELEVMLEERPLLPRPSSRVGGNTRRYVPTSQFFSIIEEQEDENMEED
jgi:serine/threonine protein kinase/PAS domain-containing protein